MSATYARSTTPRPSALGTMCIACRIATVVAAWWFVLASAACSPVVRPAPFPGARDQNTDASLVGPFDGRVVDAATGSPIQDATVVAIWTYDAGDGFVGPEAAERVERTTDEAGRYRIPPAPLRVRGKTVRLVAFHLVIYKRGYAGYRSATTFEGLPRKDFYARQNQVELRKWQDTDSHAEHLLYLAAPRAVAKLTTWERELANVDLYRAQGGTLPSEEAEPSEAGTPEEAEATTKVLDASGLLSPEAVRQRTGYTDAFEIKDLGDLSREPFYHGVHLQAVGHGEPWDVAYRVWRQPPGGLETVKETLQATMPGETPTGEVTDDTWTYEAEDVRAVGFLDREREVGVLLTCGASQCVDMATVIILARVIHDNLDQLALIEAPAEAPPKPEPAAEEAEATEAPTGSSPTTEPAPESKAEPEPAEPKTIDPMPSQAPTPDEPTAEAPDADAAPPDEPDDEPEPEPEPDAPSPPPNPTETSR